MNAMHIFTNWLQHMQMVTKWFDSRRGVTHLQNRIETKNTKLYLTDLQIDVGQEVVFAVDAYCGDVFNLRFGDYKRGRNKKLRCSKMETF